MEPKGSEKQVNIRKRNSGTVLNNERQSNIKRRIVIPEHANVSDMELIPSDEDDVTSFETEDIIDAAIRVFDNEEGDDILNQAAKEFESQLMSIPEEEDEPEPEIFTQKTLSRSDENEKKEKITQKKNPVQYKKDSAAKKPAQQRSKPMPINERESMSKMQANISKAVKPNGKNNDRSMLFRELAKKVNKVAAEKVSHLYNHLVLQHFSLKMNDYFHRL